MGEVLELVLDGRSKRYDPNVEPSHHHLVCDLCGEVYDVQHQVAAPPLAHEERHGMVIHSADIVYHGTCRGCRPVEG